MCHLTSIPGFSVSPLLFNFLNHSVVLMTISLSLSIAGIDGPSGTRSQMTLSCK